MKGKPFTRAGVACAGVVAGLTIAASPALAQQVPRSALAGYHSGHAALVNPLVTPAVGSSAYLGGYDVGATPEDLTQTTEFKVPKAKCANQSDLEDVFLGFELNPSSGNYYQGGETDAAADVIMYCNGTSKTPYFTLEAYTLNGGDYANDFSAKAGDTIVASISDSSAYGRTTATVTDITNGESESSAGTSTDDDDQVYLGAEPNIYYEGGGSVVDYDVPSFKSLSFTNNTVNGKTLQSVSPSAYSLDQNGDVQYQPASLSGKTFKLNGLSVH